MVETGFRPRSLTLEPMWLLLWCRVHKYPEPRDAGRALDASCPALPGCQVAELPFSIGGCPLRGIPPTEAAAYLFHVVLVGEGHPRDGIQQVDIHLIFLNLISNEPFFVFPSHQRVLKEMSQHRSALRSQPPYLAQWQAGSPDALLGDGSGSEHHLWWASRPGHYFKCH